MSPIAAELGVSDICVNKKRRQAEGHEEPPPPCGIRTGYGKSRIHIQG